MEMLEIIVTYILDYIKIISFEKRSSLKKYVLLHLFYTIGPTQKHHPDIDNCLGCINVRLSSDGILYLIVIWWIICSLCLELSSKQTF